MYFNLNYYGHFFQRLYVYTHWGAFWLLLKPLSASAEIKIQTVTQRNIM